MHTAGDSPTALRLRGVIVVPWRVALRISGALGWPRALSTASAAPYSSSTGKP